MGAGGDTLQDQYVLQEAATGDLKRPTRRFPPRADRMATVAPAPLGRQAGPGIRRQALGSGRQRIQAVDSPPPGAYGVDEDIDGGARVGENQQRTYQPGAQQKDQPQVALP